MAHSLCCAVLCSCVLSACVSTGSAPPPASLSSLTKSATDSRAKLTKDLKALFTHIGKTSQRISKVRTHAPHRTAQQAADQTKLDTTLEHEPTHPSGVVCAVQNFSVDLDNFCPRPLFESPAHSAAATQPQTQPQTGSTNPFSLQLGAAVAPADPTAPSASVSSAVGAAHYSRALESLMEETWLRDGRMELVDALRAETGKTVWPGSEDTSAETKMAGAAAASSPSLSPGLESSRSLSPDASAPGDFHPLHAMVLSLKHRDLAPCMQWIIARKSALEQQMIRVQAEIAELREGIMTDMTDAADAPLSPAAARRKRVSFNAEEKQGEAQRPDSSADAASAADASSTAAAASPSSSAVCRVSSLTTHLSSLQSFYGSLHALQFDLHRLKFLQILTDSEDSTRRAKHMRRAHKHGHKRKGDTNGDDVESADPLSSNGAGAGDLGLPPRKDHRKLASESSMRDDPVSAEEEAALAADQTSSEGEDEHDEQEGNSDEELNAMAAAGTRDAGLTQPAGREAPTSYSHHAALKYAQTFFPPFAATRMEGQTQQQERRASACVVVLFSHVRLCAVAVCVAVCQTFASCPAVFCFWVI